jgi:hypothetical protein
MIGIPLKSHFPASGIFAGAAPSSELIDLGMIFDALIGTTWVNPRNGITRTISAVGVWQAGAQMVFSAPSGNYCTPAPIATFGVAREGYYFVAWARYDLLPIDERLAWRNAEILHVSKRINEAKVQHALSLTKTERQQQAALIGYLDRWLDEAKRRHDLLLAERRRDLLVSRRQIQTL